MASQEQVGLRALVRMQLSLSSVHRMLTQERHGIVSSID